MGLVPIGLYLALGFQANAVVRQFVSLVESADAVLVAPGGANIGVYADWRFLVRILLSIKVGATPIFHWNTIGASANSLFNRISRYALRRSKLYVRERKSQQYLQKIGLPSELGPDTAFLLDPIKKEDERRVLAFVPSCLDSWHPFFRTHNVDHAIMEEFVPKIVEFAANEGYRVEILPHLRTEEEMILDRKIADRFVSGGIDASFRSDIMDYAQYDYAISQASLVIGMRYHACVLAAKNARPFLSLAYENKAVELSGYTNMHEYVINLQDPRANADALSSMLYKLQNNAKQIEAMLEETVRNTLVPRISLIVEKEVLQREQ